MSESRPEYRLGFAALAAEIPDIVGEPLEDEHYEHPTGDSLQATTRGLMVWRKADNWTAFTDGHRTWINGPNGIQERLNTERFDWEQDRVEYRPSVLWMPANVSSDTYPFLSRPRGFCLHGTRSGRSQPVTMEFRVASNWAVVRRDGLAANCTIGDDVVALHVPWTRWGWHARMASRHYISLEIAQGTAADAITDGQVRAIAWVVRQAQEVWPDVPLHMPTHAELEAWGETGYKDGKSDVFPYNDSRSDELRDRIRRRLEEI
jgi:hypothetical protein